MSEIKEDLTKLKKDVKKLGKKYSNIEFNKLVQRIENMEKHVYNLIVVIDEEEDAGRLVNNERKSVAKKPGLDSIGEKITCVSGYEPCPDNPHLCVHHQLDKDFSKKICKDVRPKQDNIVYMERSADMRPNPHSRYMISIDNFPVAHSDNLDVDFIPGSDYLYKHVPMMSINNLRGLSAQQMIDLEKKYGGNAEANIAIGEGAEDIVALRKGAEVVL